MLFALLYCIIVSDRESKKPGLESPGDFVYLSAAAAAVSAIAETNEEYGDNYNPKALVIKKIAKALTDGSGCTAHIHNADTDRTALPLTSERFLRSDIMLCKG